MKRIVLVFGLLVSVVFVYSQEELGYRLLQAVMDNRLDSVRLLVSLGADVNFTDEFGVTPLMYASDAGDSAIVMFLLNHGAKPNIVPSYSTTALGAAVIAGHNAIVKMLLEHGARPDLRDNRGLTPLFYAVYYGNYGAADLLMFHGANPNEVVRSWTMLELASYFDDTLLVNMLIYYGADVNKVDPEGFTAAHVASQFNAKKVLRVLYLHGADLNATAGYNTTPLALGIYQRNDGIVSQLLQDSVRTDIFLDNKFDPYRLAVMVQNYPAKKLLRRYGTRPTNLTWGLEANANIALNAGDVMSGLDLRIDELDFNTSLSFGFLSRFTPHRVLIKQSEHLYYQFWEHRWDVYTGFDKAFYLFKYKRANFYFDPGISFGFSYASYNGTMMNNSKFYLSPELGLKADLQHFVWRVKVCRLPVVGEFSSPYFLIFSMGYRILPYNLRISLKHTFFK